MPTTCVWLDGLASNTTEQFLTRHFCRYGHVVKVNILISLPYCPIYAFVKTKESLYCFPCG